MDTNYEVLVVSYNAQGESPSSAPITVYVGEAVPTGNPQNIQTEALSSTEIKISWEVSHCHIQNVTCIERGYVFFSLIRKGKFVINEIYYM